MPNPVIKQSLDRVKFTQLKGLKNLDIHFGNKKVTAIFGVNGCGKSTILHALACLYRPCSAIGEKNYFTRFFKRENRVTWIGSKLYADFTIEGTPRNGHRYEKRGDRWTPRIDKRPQRDVVYIGINSCVPDIEQATVTTSKYNMGLEEEVERRNDIICSASQIMNYSYNNYVKTSFRKKKYKKVTRNGEIKYSSLAMGAGEQRLFSLLEILYAMPAYSLLLIDELDLTLHTSALMRLVDEMVKVAERKHVQIVFTTHREELALREDINIRHIWNANDGSQSFVLNHTTPDCILRLTGRMEKRLEVYVEDDLSEYIAREVVRAKGLLSYTSFHRFGAIENAFVVAAGLDIQEANSEDKIFLMDGDKYRTEEERIAQMKKCYSGNEDGRTERRERALSHIKQYILPEEEQPEHFLWTKLKESDNDLAKYAQEINEVADDKHSYLYDVQQRSGESRESFLTRLTNILAKQEFWSNYVSELEIWLDARKNALGL